MLSYLRRACASVADQAGATWEHIVIDGASSDGTAQWLAGRPDMIFVSEPDRGMYDAINKGIERASGRFITYLNCDEQYLSGTLAAVKSRFLCRPNIDLLFGNTLLIRKDGSLLGYRKAYPVRSPYIRASHLYVHSGSMFIRRHVFDSGLRFDPAMAGIGDMIFVLESLRSGWKPGLMPQFLSAFTITGSNLSQSQRILKEEKVFAKNSLPMGKLLRPVLNALRLIEKTAAGAYVSGPIDYAVFVDERPERTSFHFARSSWRWPKAA